MTENDDTMDARPDGGSIINYGIEDKPPLGESALLGLQHLGAMFLSTVAIPLVIAGAVGLSGTQTTYVVQMALLVAGIATLVQAFSVGPVGARLPIVMGTSAIFAAPLIDIGGSFGVAAIFGAVIVAAPVEIVIAYFYDDLRGLFPPLVTSIVVMLVGLTLISVAIDYAAGGPGAETYGEFTNIGLALLVFAIAIGLNQFFDGFLSVGSVLIAVVVGYLAAIPLGLLDLSGVASAGLVSLPRPLAFGVSFEPAAILIVAFAYVITSIETIGDIEGTTGAVDRRPDDDEMTGGLFADGVMSMIAGLFGAFPNTSFSQNVGLIGFTGVASRFVVAISGVFLVLLGFLPKVAAVVGAMPNAVLGGAAIVLFGMIFSIGLRIFTERVEASQRNLTIVAVSIVLGVGVEIRPDAIAAFPDQVQVLIGSGLLVGGLTAVVLNAILPGDRATPESASAPEGVATQSE